MTEPEKINEAPTSEKPYAKLSYMRFQQARSMASRGPRFNHAVWNGVEQILLDEKQMEITTDSYPPVKVRPGKYEEIALLMLSQARNWSCALSGTYNKFIWQAVENALRREGQIKPISRINLDEPAA